MAKKTHISQVRSKMQTAYYKKVSTSAKMLSKLALKNALGKRGSAKMALMQAVRLVNEEAKKGDSDV